MRVAAVQTSFLGGEISPSAQGAVDSEIYAKGLAVCQNAIPTIQGSVRRRQGTLSARLSGGLAVSRLFNFPNREGNDWCVEITESKLTVYKRIGTEVTIEDGVTGNNLLEDPTFERRTVWGGGQVYKVDAPSTHYGGGNVLIDDSRNPDGASGSGNLYYFGNYSPYDITDYYTSSRYKHYGQRFWPSVVGASCKCVPTVYDKTDNSEVAVVGASNMSLSAQVDLDEVPNKHIAFFTFRYVGQLDDAGFNQESWSDGTPIPPAPTDNDINSSRGKVATSQPTHKLRVQVKSQMYEQANPGTSSSYIHVDMTVDIQTVGDVYNIVTPEWDPSDHVLPAGWVWQAYYIRAWIEMTDMASTDATPIERAVVYGEVSAPFLGPVQSSGGTQAIFDHDWSQTHIFDIVVDVDPSNQVMALCHQDREPRWLKRDTNGNWTFEKFSDVTGWVPPAAWAAGDYPVAPAFFQGRLWLGGCKNEGGRLLASRTGTFMDFAPNPSDPALETDPMAFPLAVTGNIAWLKAHKELVIGTSRDEWIGTSVSGVISNADRQFNKQSAWGSRIHIPKIVGRDIVYIQAPPSKVRSMRDEGDESYGYASKDITQRAEHLFRSGISELGYLDDPHHMLMMLSAIDVVGMVFDPDSATQAAFQFTSPSGYPIVSISVTADADGSVMWISRKYVDEGIHMIELYAEEGLPQSLHDGAVIGQVPNDRKVSGLDPWNGFPVDIIVRDPEGAYHTLGMVTVVNGDIIIPGTVVGDYSIGAPFKMNVESLPLEGSSNIGTSQIDKRKFSEVGLRLINSSIPTVNGSEYNPNDDFFEGVVEDNPIVTGDIFIRLDGYSDGVIKLSQEKSLPVEVAGFFGVVRSSNR